MVRIPEGDRPSHGRTPQFEAASSPFAIRCNGRCMGRFIIRPLQLLKCICLERRESTKYSISKSRPMHSRRQASVHTQSLSQSMKRAFDYFKYSSSTCRETDRVHGYLKRWKRLDGRGERRAVSREQVQPGHNHTNGQEAEGRDRPKSTVRKRERERESDLRPACVSPGHPLPVTADDKSNCC